MRMQILNKRWDCRTIAHNARYLATIGTGVTIWNRETLEQIHHFTGIRWIHGGIFVNDDVLMIYTGEQKLYFLSIQEKRILWSAPRPKELATSGDMHCCRIPGTEKVACVARGKKSLNDLFFLCIDWSNREISLQRIPDCYRVISSIVWTQELGLTFLSYQAKGDNMSHVHRIFQVTETGTFSILLDGEDSQIVRAYSGNHLFVSDKNELEPKMYVYALEQSADADHLKLGIPKPLPLPTIRMNGPVGINRRRILPYIQWIDEKSGLLTTCHTAEWIGICDFRNQKLIQEYPHSSVYYGKILDDNLLLGCAPGFSVVPLGLKAPE